MICRDDSNLLRTSRPYRTKKAGYAEFAIGRAFATPWLTRLRAGLTSGYGSNGNRKVRNASQAGS